MIRTRQVGLWIQSATPWALRRTRMMSSAACTLPSATIKQLRVEAGAFGLDDGAVEQAGELLAGTAGAEPQPGAGGDDGQAGDGAEGGPAVALRDPQPRLFEVPVGDEGQRPIST